MFTISSLEESLIALWQDRGWQVATCESCTGGYIASRLTLHAGSSAWFRGGVVSYQIPIKEQLVGVPSEIIDRHGVVSSAVAEAMARGMQRVCRADVAIATTGVAGPSGGTPKIPVGTVCVALLSPLGLRLHTLHLEGDRREIIEQTYREVIERLYLWLCVPQNGGTPLTVKQTL